MQINICNGRSLLQKGSKNYFHLKDDDLTFQGLKGRTGEDLSRKVGGREDGIPLMGNKWYLPVLGLCSDFGQVPSCQLSHCRKVWCLTRVLPFLPHIRSCGPDLPTGPYDSLFFGVSFQHVKVQSVGHSPVVPKIQ